MKRYLTLWLTAMLAALQLPAVAAETIDEIIVTADFRERSLLDVPFSVSVMDAAFIEETAVQHFEELINLVPNMNWSGDGHRARYFQIRGVGELEQYQGAPNPSIGFLIDDIDFSGIGTVATLFDMQSVEVLRGPQGSRYGANALGGLVYLKSVSPSADRDGRVLKASLFALRLKSMRAMDFAAIRIWIATILTAVMKQRSAVDCISKPLGRSLRTFR
jgi:outer membrane receptor protein involved in Fe transport